MWQEQRSGDWRLEGFGKPSDFADGAPIFGRSRDWRSATPFLAAGHLKADRHAGEFRRLVRRMGMDERFGFRYSKDRHPRAEEYTDWAFRTSRTHFHRFRSRGGEKQHDTRGALLQVTFPVPVNGPVAMGYGSHFGLGLFVVQPRSSED